MNPNEFRTLHYSETSLFNFLHTLEQEAIAPQQGRRVVMAFGLERLDRSRLKTEMERLNLGRERIFERNIILVFWLNRAAFLDEFRRQAADFWDWHSSIGQFTTKTLEDAGEPCGFIPWMKNDSRN